VSGKAGEWCVHSKVQTSLSSAQVTQANRVLFKSISSDLQRVKVGDAGFHHVQVHFYEVKILVAHPSGTNGFDLCLTIGHTDIQAPLRSEVEDGIGQSGEERRNRGPRQIAKAFRH
jgi:hypothetical protein